MDINSELLPMSEEAKDAASSIPNAKVVIILNERVDAGRLMNACAHVALGFGASRTADQSASLRLLDYKDAAGESHSCISALSIVVLKANANQLRTLRQKAREAGVSCIDFVSTMTEGSFLDQLERTKWTSPDELVYFGVLLFGTHEELRPLTRKYSLFRGPTATESEGTT